MDVLTDKKSPSPEMSGSMIEPAQLYLSFSTATDAQKIHEMLCPDVARQFDPEGFVMRRAAAVMDNAIENGDVALVKDDSGEILALNVAYRYDGEHPFTEIGTVLRRVRGLGHVVVAAQALREEFRNNPDHAIAAKVSAHNQRALNFFSNSLKWQQLGETDQMSQHFTAAANGVQNGRIWFEAKHEASIVHRNIFLEAIRNGSPATLKIKPV